MIILINILILSAILGLLAGLYFFLRIPLCRKNSNGKTAKRLSLIIPARNEQDNIPVILGSLRLQELKPLEVIVVDDNSTDRTKEIALSFGATVVDSKPLPDGWTGKNWACHQGAKSAKGEIFLFLDADTKLESDGLLKIIATFEDSKGVVSICPYHKIKKVYENLSSFFNIIMMAGSNAFTFKANNASNKGLFGQCMILSKDDYEKVGGHEAVKGKILENFFLSQKFSENLIPTRCYGGKGTISMRMFPRGLADLMRGWSKAFASGAGNTQKIILVATILWISGGIIAFILPVYVFYQNYGIGFKIVWPCIYLLYVIQILWMVRRIGAFSFLTGILFPVHLVFYNIVFAKSLFSLIFMKKVKWKDRDVLENS